ncbi:hypothetical protein CP989_24500, partial [Enterobacter hormaechei]|uniref:hypothetical protein n=1 Tax=Enterobacter hormaechei TaxID=158836 RepID=UPI000BD25FEE
ISMTTISQSPEALLREILSTKPAVVNFSEKTGTADDPVDFADASALATAAQNYQAEQAKQGAHHLYDDYQPVAGGIATRDPQH